MTRLLRHDLKVTWIISRDTNGLRNDLYKQKMKRTTYKEGNQTLQNNSLLLSD